MPLIFTNPALLLGALAGAVPVIIHFLSRRKVRRQQFSDLRFLNEVQARQARSLGIRRWLLLLLRVLAILLVALGVAGPRWGGLVSGSDANPSVLLAVDTSASMSTETDQGSRLDQARAACEAMIASLPDRATVQIITSGGGTRALYGDWLPARSGAGQGLDLIQQTAGSFDPAAVVREASRQVARAPSAQVQMVWISDFQEPDLGDEMLIAARTLEQSGQVQHLLRQVGKEVPGGGVLDISLPLRALRRGENVTLTAEVTAQFDEEVFILEMDGRPVAEAVVNQSSPEPRQISFALPVPGPGLHRGIVRKESDLFALDDSRPFVLEVPEALDVLLVHGKNRAVDEAAGRGGWRFLAEALAPGTGPQSIRLQRRESGQLTTGDLAGNQVVFFVDPDPLGRRVSRGLMDWLAAGGSACFLLGEPAQATYYGGTLLPGLDWSGSLEYLGGNAAQPQLQRARILDRNHPIFFGLEDEALATVEDIQWKRWFRLPEDSFRVLLELADESPLVLEKEWDQGRVVVLPFNLLRNGSGLVTSPMALPFFQRLTYWLAGRGGMAAGINLEVGQVPRVFPRLSRKQNLLEQTETLIYRDETTGWEQPANLVWQGNSPLLVGTAPDQSGFSVFQAAGQTVGLVAATVPRSESRLSLLTPEQWEKLMSEKGLEVTADLNGPGVDDLSGLLAGYSLAPWFFLLAVGLLLLELYIGRGASPSPAISG